MQQRVSRRKDWLENTRTMTSAYQTSNAFFVVTVAVLVYYAHAFSSFADWPKGSQGHEKLQIKSFVNGFFSLCAFTNRLREIRIRYKSRSSRAINSRSCSFTCSYCHDHSERHRNWCSRV
jgi:hypothetical protein